ncbi:molybdenum cofactor guanylyltransferase [Ignavibacteria bacterium]|nr:molybdenum cofactor guanylyltransferase [Bacteroidota bacterium]MCZ2133353.1 molybdenum cofactor guanylyltransferase [Bacteroidota bacterium]
MKGIKNIETFVLAGGKSSRMGQDKGLMLFRDKPMISHILEKINLLHLPLKIIANNNDYKQFGYETVKDIIKDKGPMGGLFTAFHNTKADFVFLFACDMPFISVEAVQKIIAETDDDDVTVASVQNKINPLFAIYKTTLCDNISKRMASNKLKMLEFIESVKYKKVEMYDLTARNAALLMNINSIDDLINSTK